MRCGDAASESLIAIESDAAMSALMLSAAWTCEGTEVQPCAGGGGADDAEALTAAAGIGNT